MVCIRKNLKVHTQELKPGSNHIHEPGPVFKSRFKTFSKSEVEDGEFEFAITLRKEELLNHDNCTWLSIGDASTPSSCYKDNGLFGYTDLKIDAWFISLLSTDQSPTSDTLFNTKTTFFDGSRANPMEEAYLILDQMKVLDECLFFHENLEEEEVASSLSWLENESSDSFQEQTNSQILDTKSNSKRAFFDCSDVNSLISSASSFDQSSEISAYNPLFWSFNSASDSDSETKWDFFDMSPRKKADNSTKNMNILATDTKSKSKSNSKRAIFDCSDVNSMISSASSFDHSSEIMDSEELSAEKPLSWPFNSGSDSDSENKWDSFDMSPRKKAAEFDSLTKKYDRKHKIVLEDLLLADKLNVDGVIIEQVLGLCEFDGHEGIESEFNKDHFSIV